MTLMPGSAAIDAAELRVIQSRRNIQQSVDRSRSAVRTFIARPSTLILVTLVSGVTAFFLTPRRRTSVKDVPDPAESTTKAPSRSLLRTFVSMYGVRLLTLALQLHAAAGIKNGASNNVNNDTPPGTSDSGASANPEHVTGTA